MAERFDVDVAVVGGGITGLAAAYSLVRSHPSVKVAVLEGSDRLGGKIHTTSFEGIRIETGADSFLARDEVVTDLCVELGIRDELAPPAVFGAVVWTAGGPRRMPAGTVMGVPGSIGAALRAEPLTWKGRLRALADFVLPGPLSGPDVAIGPFIRKRFGVEVLDRMVDPILAGTRAGDPDRLSLSACMQPIDAAARTHRSVMGGLGKASGPPPFLAPQDGMTRLIDALAGAIDDVDVATNEPVSEIRAAGLNSYELVTRDRIVGARSVIVAIPGPAAARVLAPLAPDVAGALAEIDHASVAGVTLVYPAGTLSPPPGTSGFLVPRGADRLLSAGTWWSVKWPGTGPADRMAVRAFVGRSGDDPALNDDDEALIRGAAREIAQLVRTTTSPSAGRVDRWPAGLPQYEVGHGDRIERIERALYPYPGLLLAGADYRGTGIPDCIRQGRAVAQAAIKSLQGALGRNGNVR